MAAVLCPLCGTRQTKRACPALGQQICAVCCATKRLVQIQCPSDCVFLATARNHPSAAVVRRQQRDVGFAMEFLRDLDERQSSLFGRIGTFLVRYHSPDLSPLIDVDVADAMQALASTYETSVRGVIYDHIPASLPAQRVVAALKPLLDDFGKSGGTAFERDAAVVMRRMEKGVADVRAIDPDNRRAFLDLLARLIVQDAVAKAEHDAKEPPPSRLIVP
jgi:hypothetical protein